MHKYVPTGCSLNIVFFSLKFCDFSELCQFWCSAGVLPAIVYTHGHHRVDTERGQSPEYILIFLKKKTIFNEHPVHVVTSLTLYSDWRAFRIPCLQNNFLTLTIFSEHPVDLYLCGDFQNKTRGATWQFYEGDAGLFVI